MVLKEYIEARVLEIAAYILETKCTVRRAAKMYGVSKSTVHKDMAERLREINPQIAGKIKEIMELNKAQRHLRGGRATRLKYQKGYKKHG